MRRALIVCLMLLLPVQWVWAAAASTCSHEPAAATVHFGHHAHQHVGIDTDVDTERDPAGVDHPDCSVCHLWAAKVCADASSLSVANTTARHVPASMLPFASHISSGPERPDRRVTS